MNTTTNKSKYTVHWVTSGEEKTHGTFDTFDEAMQSILDWWKKHYGLHSAFYQIVKERD